MIVLSGDKTRTLAESIAKGLGADYEEVEIKKFPDSESYVRVHKPVKGEECMVVHSTTTNDDLIELFLMLNSVKEHGARKITCVLPYLAYSRQDKIFLEGEASSAKVILSVIDDFADEIITINAHFFDEGGKQRFHHVHIHNLDAFPTLGKYFENIDKPVVIAPDKGSFRYAKEAAKEINADFDYLEKTRLNGEEVQMKPKSFDLKGRNIVILDDMISTGGTIVTAAKMLKEQGTKSIRVGCVHGVFAKGTDRFKGVVDEMVCTDTIPGKLSKVSVAELIVDALT